MLTRNDITQLKKIFVTRDEFHLGLKKITETITETIIGELTEVITITSNGLQNEIDEFRNEFNEFRQEMRNITANHELRLDRLEDKVYS